MFIVVYDARGYINVRDGISEDGQIFDSLPEALDCVRLECVNYSREADDYTIFTPHQVKMETVYSI